MIGFQLDNETKPYDTCSKYAQAKFVEYLKNEFPDIDEFNREFGLDYWSNRVDDWDAFPDIRGTINMSLDAEYKKFQRKLVTDFFAWQADIVKNTREMTSSSLTISTLNGTITLTACNRRSTSTRLPSVWISQAAIYITLPRAV